MKARCILFFALFFALLAPPDSQAQTPVSHLTQIGSDLESTYSPVINPYYAYSMAEFFVNSFEIQGGAQSINSMELLFGSSQGSLTRNIDVYIVHSTSSVFVSSNFVPVPAGTAPVFSGNYTFTANWNTITFTTPFQYNGTSNLAIIIRDHTGYAGANPNTLRESTSTRMLTSGFPSANKLSYYIGTSNFSPTSYNNAAIASSSGTSVKRPVFRLNGTSTATQLIYSNTFENETNGDSKKPLGWEVKDGNRYNWSISNNGFGTTASTITTGHNSTKCLRCGLRDRDNSDRNLLLTSWFDIPTNADSIRVSLWFINSMISTTYLPLTASVQSYSQANTNYNWGDIFSSSSSITRSAQTSWTYVTATIAVSSIGREPFRLRIGDIGTNTANIGGSILIDDLKVEAICATREYDLAQGPYTEDFDGYSSCSDAGWTHSSCYPSSLRWNIFDDFSSTSYLTSSHSGNSALRCYYYHSDTTVYANMYSPKLRVPTDRANYDSVIVSFWYASPLYGSDHDQLRIRIFNASSNSVYTAKLITQQQSNWTYYRWAIPATNVPDTFSAMLTAKPRYGYGIFVDDIQVSYKRTYPIHTVASPAYAGTATGGGAYDIGDLVHISATPAAGHTFLHWLASYDGGTPYICSTVPNFDINVTSDQRNVTFTAVFSSVHNLALGPYSEGFNSRSTLSESGWTQGSCNPDSYQWTIYNSFSSRVPPYTAHDGAALYCHNNQTGGHFFTYLSSPQFTIPANRKAQDSVIVDFWIANPTNGSHYDSLKAYILYNIPQIVYWSSHNSWVHVHKAYSAVLIPDTFDIKMLAYGQNGGGIFIDDIQVSYKRMCRIQAVATPAGAGIVTGSGLYVYGDEAQLSAVAYPGYTFQRWTCASDQLSPMPFGSTPQFPLSLGEYFNNATFTAVFTPEIHDDTARIPQDVACTDHLFSIQPNNPTYGVTTRPNSINIRHGSRFESMAIANPGYHFVRWSGGTTANPLVLTNINQDIWREAIFLPDSPITATVPWAISFDTCVIWSTPSCITEIVKYETRSTSPLICNFYDQPLLTLTGSGIFILPQFNVAISDLQVTFTYKSSVTVQVGVVTDPSNPSSFVPLSTLDPTYSASEIYVPLSEYTGQGGYIAFKYGSESTPLTGYTLEIASISVTENH